MYEKIVAFPDTEATKIVWSQPGMNCNTGLNRLNNTFETNGCTATVKDFPSLSTGCSDANHTRVGFDDGDRLILADPGQGPIRIRLDPPARGVWTQVAALSSDASCSFTCRVRAIGDHGEVKTFQIPCKTATGTLDNSAQCVGIQCAGDEDEDIRVLELQVVKPDSKIMLMAINQLSVAMAAGAATAAGGAIDT